MRSMRWTLALAWLLSAPVARADVTVLYPEPAPRAPLVAEIVPEVATELVELAPSTEPEPSRPEPTEPAPTTEGPVPSISPTPDIGSAASTTTPDTAATAVAAETTVEPTLETPSAPVHLVRVGDGSGESITITLLDEEGRPSPTALTALSVLARPSGVDAPSEAALAAHAGNLEWVAPELRRLHPGLLVRLAALCAEFAGHTVEIVSGYRPDARDSSRHRIGSALDVRVVGVRVSDVDSFLRSLPETGVGLYPTTDFVHVDVRARSAHWIDVSGPGEAPRSPSASPRAETARSTPRSASPASGVAIDAEAMANDVARALEGLRF